jgi:hypothetical protein
MNNSFSYLLFIIIFGFSCVRPVSSYASDYLIGTYYFPGWTDYAKGLEYQRPWDPIKKFPKLEPLLGWYKDNDPDVLAQQTTWMAEYGIDFVVFDWYWDGKNPYLEQAVTAFKKSHTPGKIRYSLLWANHYRFPGMLPEFRLMVRYWIAKHFSDQDYLQIDGQPVVFVFAVEDFELAAKKMGLQLADLVAEANALARKAGYKGIYFVAGTPALSHWVNAVAPAGNISALSAYNYHMGYSGSAASATRVSHNFIELDSAYRKNWDWILTNSTLPYIIPMTSGWDKRPWGGSKDSLHDQSVSSPAEFEAHLQAAKILMDQYPIKTLRMGVICCWNEFGEGSFIEPTKIGGYQYLEKVRKVFRKSAK